MFARRYQKVALVLALLAVLAPSGAFAAPPSASGSKPKYMPMKPFEDLSLADSVQEMLKEAAVAYQRGRLDEAEKLFKKVLALEPKNPDAHFNLGVIAESRGDLRGALGHYKTALTYSPADKSLAEAVAEVQTKIKQKEEALSEEQKARREVDLAGAGERAGEAFRSGDYYESARQLNVLVKSFPRDANVRFALGQSLRALKQYAWSAFHLKMAIYLQPENDEYRKALVELDEEVQQAREQAILDSAKIAVTHVRPLFGGEAFDIGL